MEPLPEEPSEELAILERVVEKLTATGLANNSDEPTIVTNNSDEQAGENDDLNGKSPAEADLHSSQIIEEIDSFPSLAEMPRILSPKTKLRDYCMYKDYPQPIYILLNITRTRLHQKWYTMELTIPSKLTVNESAISKRMAEFRAATKAIHIIAEQDPDIYRPIPKSNFSLTRSLSMDYLSRRLRRRVTSNGSINTMMTFNNLSSYAPSMEGMDSITENGDGADSLYGSEHGKKFVPTNNSQSVSPDRPKRLQHSNEQNSHQANQDSHGSNNEQISTESHTESLDEGVFVEGSEATSARSSALATPLETPNKSVPTAKSPSGSTLERKKSRSSSSILASIFSLGIWKPKPRTSRQSTSRSNDTYAQTSANSRMELYETLDQPDNVPNGKVVREEQLMSKQSTAPETESASVHINESERKSPECRHFSLYGSVLCCNPDSPIVSVQLDRTSCAMLLKYCVLLYLPIPYYDIHFDHNAAKYKVTCRLLITNNEHQISNIKAHLRPLFDKVREHRGDLSGRGSGDSLRSARNAAAEKVIAKLRGIGAYLEN